MEELLVIAILYYAGIISEEIYIKKLDALFLDQPEDEILLDLQWESDIKRSIIYITSHINYAFFNNQKFGRLLMDRLAEYYHACSEIHEFADKMYPLWETLPGRLQNEPPFWMLSYADDPLSWGDEAQTRDIYENMLNYYKDKP